MSRLAGLNTPRLICSPCLGLSQPIHKLTLPDRTIATDPAPDHSAPDISELLDRTVVGNPTPAQEPEADLSRLQVPTEATVEPLPELTFEDDYTAVLRRLVAHFKTTPALRTTVLDFEAAVWNAMRAVFPDVELRGCSFHWSQALWKHIQELRLTCSYMKRSLTHKFIRRLFSLPFLPAHAITPVFDSILTMPDIAEPLCQLLNYIKNTWISSRIWCPSSWSVYNSLIRTNNDVEGWHRCLNSRIHRHNLPLYQLIQVLYEEATILPLQAQLVSEGKLTRHEKTRNKQQQQKIVSIWDRYDHKELTELGVLKEIAIVYRPVTRVR